MVPRFSIHNVFTLKEEMDATKWGDILIATAKDWAVPDVIENSETYKKVAVKSKKQVCVEHRTNSAGLYWLGGLYCSPVPRVLSAAMQ